VEKILNDVTVKTTLQSILDETSKHVSRLRQNHSQTPDLLRMMTNKPIKRAMDKLNLSFEGFNDRDSTSLN